MRLTSPAKTFLLGEYLALSGGPSLVLTTTPYFELEVSACTELSYPGIHQDSPAGQYILAYAGDFNNLALRFNDPYQGTGGLGASTAQFLTVYKAHHRLLARDYTLTSLQASYRQFAWNGEGPAPSGHDLLAQDHFGLSVIENHGQTVNALDWPFTSLAFILLRTNEKLPTHHHLHTLKKQPHYPVLNTIVSQALIATKQADASGLTQCVNAYYAELLKLNLVADHTKSMVESLRLLPEVLAAKGCGAMGADIVLLLCHQDRLSQLTAKLKQTAWPIVADSSQLARAQATTV